MQKAESMFKNETHLVFWDFFNYLIPARKPDLALINKKKRTYHFLGLAFFSLKILVSCLFFENLSFMPFL